MGRPVRAGRESKVTRGSVRSARAVNPNSRFLTGLGARFGMTSPKSGSGEMLSIGRNYTIGVKLLRGMEI